MSVVFRRELPTELKVMPFTLRVMTFVGLWENRKCFYRFMMAYSWGAFVVLFPKAVLGIGSNRFDAIAKGIAELFYQSNLSIGAGILAAKRNYFKQMVDLLTEVIEEVTGKDQPENCYEEIRKQNRAINRFAKFYAIYVTVGPFVFCIPPVAVSYLRYFATSGNSSEVLEFELPMEQRFYGLQIRTNFVHYNIFVLCSISAYCGYAVLSLIKVSSTIAMMKYCALMYRLIAMQIKHFSTLPEDTPKAQKLARIVRLHNSAFRVTQLAENILNIPLMVQFMSCMLFWCLAMFYVSTNIDISLVNVMVVFALSLIETYGYSYLGTEISNEAAEVGRAIYDLAWYDESAELQNQYRLVLQRSQLETRITAAKFFTVGIEQFGSITQMSYSYYLVLKDSLSAL
ncbi:uncharacterized protein LOC129773301 [Toxorhynchites rutilus septentrionalis]|uniref:uncharacterized protein LOC129773301 n=1 Tax=Toxorhynchites rutilus septentrionalis TaxID=329112 RepID=UPI00247AE0E7|nr:uncharacterized protein LOC129773301 [Toxorhynchites rutilus septentrionalis]